MFTAFPKENKNIWETHPFQASIILEGIPNFLQPSHSVEIMKNECTPYGR